MNALKRPYLGVPFSLPGCVRPENVQKTGAVRERKILSIWHIDQRPRDILPPYTTHQSSSMSHDQFFPPIGQLAKQADDMPEEPTASDGDVQEDRPLEEVESLCMRCREQVSSRLTSLSGQIFNAYACSSPLTPIAGNDPHDAYVHSVLWRSHRDELPLRTLRRNEQRDTVCWSHPRCACFTLVSDTTGADDG